MDVIVNGFGASSNVPAQVDPSTSAIRATLRPTEWVQGAIIGGHFSIGTQTGTMAAGIASAAQVFQMRWADPAKLFVLKHFVVQAATGTAFAAASFGCPLELIVGHGSTANGSGGAALAPNSISNKMRNVMASSAFVTSGELRIATTAALTAATGQTLEPAAISECMGAPGNALTQSPVMSIFEERDFGVHPLVLAAGDTLVMRTLNPGATGTWAACVTMEWLEVVNL
jgi:hypothetical protein